MRAYTPDELKEMSLEEAQRVLSNTIYEATWLVESLELAGKVCGNGHHARQKLAAHATLELLARWNDKEEAETLREKTENTNRIMGNS